MLVPTDRFLMEILEMSTPKLPGVAPASLPPSCLGPDGNFRTIGEEERRHVQEIDQMTDEDPPGAFEQFMRNFDESHPHRPQFKGYY